VLATWHVLQMWHGSHAKLVKLPRENLAGGTNLAKGRIWRRQHFFFLGSWYTLLPGVSLQMY